MLITRNDIQRIGDEETLLCFLEERLNLPIPAEATLAQIALLLPLPFLGLDEFIAEQIIDCQDFRGLPKEGLGDRRPFLIRFRSEQDYSDILREVAGCLHQKNTNPADLFFICADECFQPFAFAYFNDSESGNWDAAVLNILAWTQENTNIHTGSEHELPTQFFTSKSSEDFDEKTIDATSEEEDISPTKEGVDDEESTDSNILANADDRDKTAVGKLWEIFNNKTTRHRINPTLSANLLTKLENIGTSLGQQVEIHGGHRIQPGCNAAFVLNDFKYQKLIAEDAKSKELIKPVVRTRQERESKPKWKWKPEWQYLIWISSSKFRHWPWSKAYSEVEADQIFADNYPAISRHLYKYRHTLKACAAKKQEKFYWEIPLPVPTLGQDNRYYHPKIIYHADGMSLSASYDESGSFILGNYTPFIPTEDISLLAILNSKLFHFYAKATFQAEYETEMLEGWLTFKKKNMVTFPVANRTEAQKTELSRLVQQILEDPDSPEVPALEEEINMLVYKLYGLTVAEIVLIEEESN